MSLLCRNTKVVSFVKKKKKKKKAENLPCVYSPLKGNARLAKNASEMKALHKTCIWIQI